MKKGHKRQGLAIYTIGDINYASSTSWKLKDTEVEQSNLKKKKKTWNNNQILVITNMYMDP